MFCCHGYITQTSSQSEVEDWTTAIHCGEYTAGFYYSVSARNLQFIFFMYVYMYVCMYVCMYVYVFMYVCIYIFMYVCIYVFMYVCIYVCMYVCMYVCSRCNFSDKATKQGRSCQNPEGE